ncbi:MAG: hypothetical protein F4X65_06620 [Chloroflexi bacterium]|nr:hypothetical protein [Chloroflexota bacterium]
MTQLNSFEDLLAELDANPEWRDALRERILTDELTRLPAEFNAFARRTGERMDRLEGDMGTIKGNQARADTLGRADDLAADLGLIYRRNLSGADLYRMARAAQRAGMNLNQDTMRSFRQADLIIQGQRNGEVEYIAAEISWTADSRDSNRAMRNAGIVRAATGRPCIAAVASVRNTNQVQELADSGAIHWHQLEDRGPAQVEG